MSSCSNSEFAVSDVTTTATETAEYYVIDYPLFIACLWVPIIVLFMCAIHWTNRQLNQLKSDIYDQQDKCEVYSQTNINKYNYILSKMEEDNASLREYVLVLETRVARLQSIAPTESTMIRIRDDANANYANLGQRIISIRTQCINALHELDNKYQLKCDDLTANVSNLTRRLDAVQADDVYKLVLIGYRRITANGCEEPLFCPRYTTDFDKYLGNSAILILDSLAQLPMHKPFIFTDYYFYRRTNNVLTPVSTFIDLHLNIVAYGVNGAIYPDNFGLTPGATDNYNNAYKKVQEYCEKIGVKCL